MIKFYFHSCSYFCDILPWIHARFEYRRLDARIVQVLSYLESKPWKLARQYLLTIH